MTSQHNQTNQPYQDPQLPGSGATFLIPSDGSPKNRRDFDVGALRGGLSHVAKTLHRSSSGHVLLVGIGQAIRMLSPHGVPIPTDHLDVLGTCFLDESRAAFEAAAKLAADASQEALPRNWAITETQEGWGNGLSPDLHKTITREALVQDFKVFDKLGLTVCAAPWEYQLSRAVALLEESELRWWLRDEAVYYLHEYAIKYGRPDDCRITTKNLEWWKKKYQCNFSLNFMINVIGDRYFQQYHHNPFQG